MVSSSFRVTTVCLMMVMVAVAVMEAAAVLKAGGQSKHSAKTHRKPAAVEVETVQLQLDPSVLVPSGNIRPLENASISPWTYNVSSDETLFPPLSEARCLLRGCLDVDGREVHNLESRPILRQVLLLRRVRPTEAEQSYSFRLESRLIAVGCTCVRPFVNTQQ